jgi:hypothetical protein
MLEVANWTRSRSTFTPLSNESLALVAQDLARRIESGVNLSPASCTVRRAMVLLQQVFEPGDERDGRDGGNFAGRRQGRHQH